MTVLTLPWSTIKTTLPRLKSTKTPKFGSISRTRLWKQQHCKPQITKNGITNPRKNINVY